MVSSYVSILSAGAAYTAPSAGTITVQDAGTGNPIEGATLTIRKQGQSTEYQLAYTDAIGQALRALCEEDENYDLIVAATGYTSWSLLDQPAADIWPSVGAVGLVAI